MVAGQLGPASLCSEFSAEDYLVQYIIHANPDGKFPLCWNPNGGWPAGVEQCFNGH